MSLRICASCGEYEQDCRCCRPIHFGVGSQYELVRRTFWTAVYLKCYTSSCSSAAIEADAALSAFDSRFSKPSDKQCFVPNQ